METCDVLVLGGGLSGISCCAILQSEGVDCLLIEKDTSLGGLTSTRVASSFVFDSHGGHVFNTKNERVKEWVFSILPECKWQHSPRVAKIWYGGKLISYPFELALSELSPEEATECIMGIFERKGEAPKSFGEWLKWNFGEAIANKYLFPYNRKIWKRDLSKMSAHWVSRKMPMPSLKEVLYAALSQNASEKKMVHSTYYYPHEGGIGGFISCITKTLKNVKLGLPLQSLEKQGDVWIVNGNIRAKKIVSTIPIPALVNVVKTIPPKVNNCISRLDWNSLTTILCEQEKGGEISWLYLPGDGLPAHRIVYQGGLAKSNCPKGKFSATYEITGIHSPEEIIKTFRNSKLPDELRAIDVLDFEHTKYAYPVYHLTFLEDIKVIQEWLKTQGIISCGRFAEWKYLNMDDCIARAFDVSDNLK